MSARRLLLWCLGAALAIELFVQYVAPLGLSAIFSQLLVQGDALGNLLLLAIAFGAFALRNRSAAIQSAILHVGSRPWLAAAALFPLLCIGTLRVYHNQPLSMDEYAQLFQAKAFAAGRLSGAYPPELLDSLIPWQFRHAFFIVSRSTGEIASHYWPGFALLLAPFAWLDIAWAANPLIGALALPVVHRLTREITESDEAAAWSVVLMLASPVFILSSMSYYAMQASLLCNAVFALLLLQPTPMRAAAAGVVGSIALTLHQPVPHLLFMLPFALWLLAARDRWIALAALVAGYLPLSLLLGVGWQQHVADLLRPVAAAASTGATTAHAQPLLDAVFARVGDALRLPNGAILQARIAGLTKIWTWAAAGLLVLAVAGAVAARGNTRLRLLAAAALTTYFGFFVFPFDQGHGWGYRYFHSAWFVLPILAAAGLRAARGTTASELQGMAAWVVALSCVLANGQRVAEVEGFVRGHLEQVPPLAQPVARDTRDVVFVDLGAGIYVQDLVQNDPYLRGPRTILVYHGEARAAEIVAQRYPGFVRRSREAWGEWWIAPPTRHTPAR